MFTLSSAQIRALFEALNDELRTSGVGRNYLAQRSDFAPFLQLDNLMVSTATSEYLLAMKCLAMRLGAEFHDETDVRFLLRYLDIETYARAVETITRFYPLEKFPQKTLYALEETLKG